MFLANPAHAPDQTLAIHRITALRLIERLARRKLDGFISASKASRLPSVQSCQSDLFRQLQQAMAA